jgi:hypothetical protein
VTRKGIELSVRPLTPPLLEDLVRAGRWPRTNEEALRQNGSSRVSAERVRTFAPEEHAIYLYHPPFAAISDLVARGDDWSDPTWHPEGLDHAVAILIGDFGLGSDAPIVLDYRSGTPPPRVLRLRWATKRSENRWVEVAPSFERFVELLGI